MTKEHPKAAENYSCGTLGLPSELACSNCKASIEKAALQSKKTKYIKACRKPFDERFKSCFHKGKRKEYEAIMTYLAQKNNNTVDENEMEAGQEEKEAEDPKKTVRLKRKARDDAEQKAREMAEQKKREAAERKVQKREATERKAHNAAKKEEARRAIVEQKLQEVLKQKTREAEEAERKYREAAEAERKYREAKLSLAEHRSKNEELSKELMATDPQKRAEQEARKEAQRKNIEAAQCIAEYWARKAGKGKGEIENRDMAKLRAGKAAKQKAREKAKQKAQSKEHKPWNIAVSQEQIKAVSEKRNLEGQKAHQEAIRKDIEALKSINDYKARKIAENREQTKLKALEERKRKDIEAAKCIAEYKRRKMTENKGQIEIDPKKRDSSHHLEDWIINEAKEICDIENRLQYRKRSLENMINSLTPERRAYVRSRM